ncbi:hypothetical protein RQP46_009210 [Phenoliferia psychrophenolica]
MNSLEVDTLVHSYLVESGYSHTSFSLLHESSIAAHHSAAAAALATSTSTTTNGRKHPRESSSSTSDSHPHSHHNPFDQPVPPGHLVRILQKGLLYLEAEARYRGDPAEPAPRLIGYSIPNALPLPPLPKHPAPPSPDLPHPPQPQPRAPTPSSSTTPAATATTNGIAEPPPPPPPPVAAPTAKEKGKGKETAAGGTKRKEPELPEKEEGEETEDEDVQMKPVAPLPAAPTTPQDEEEEEEEGAVKEDPPLAGVREVKEDDPAVVKLRGHTMPKVQPCSWNPKVPALLATGGGDSTCRIWDVPPRPDHDESGRVVREHVVCKHSSAQRRADVAAVAWDPSGSLLATGSEDGIARIWTPSGDLHLVLSMHQRTIFSLKWNTLGTMLLTGSLDNTVCLWEVNSGKVKQQWSSHSDSVLDVDWNDDQTFASASMDKSIHLFNVQRISPVNRFKGHRDEVNVVKFSPCGTLLASCSDDKSVRIWSLRQIPGFPLERNRDQAEEGRVIDDRDHAGSFVLEGHEKDVHTLAWAPWVEGQKGPRLLASASFDAMAKLWDADQGTCLHTFSRHKDYVYSIAFSPGTGAFLVTGSDDGKMCVWNVKERRLVLEYTHGGPIYEVAWSPAGTQLAVCGRTEDVAVVSFDPTVSREL